MGLPVWRAPSPEAPSQALKDPTSLSRSPIRRRRPTRSPRARDFDVQTALRSRERPARPYPPAPNVPARNPQRREEHAPQDDGSSARSYFSLVIDAAERRTGGRRTLPALTPNFAPAIHVEHRRSGPVLRRTGLTRSHTLRHAGDRSPVADQDVPAEADEDSSDNAVGFPPLRRMGRRTIADGPLPSSSLRESWSPATTFDGLGDRERSVSPVVDDHWETMLTSVAPDPLAPTAESSFASAAASASFSTSHPSSRAGSSNSNTNSATSSRTHLTIPSRRQSWSADFLRACDTSEDDSASDTEAEDEVLDSNSMRRRHTAGTTSNGPPPTRGPYSRAIREQSRESTAYVRSFYGEVPFEHARRMEEQLAAEERAATDEEMPLDQELRDARVLLERLARREDVSDDFWASVGLRRPVADRVERIQQRERL
ncbi:hypothetical protein DPSP01_006671 [Paraphaeosphaeria sporulosa]|uniref:Uncharacterized protein n=1 Tax=Paraphaeosphaeria sporulosa TaxID=1460663 RepID=A0A177CIU2_9PLEO|nr:uncharacterized protein CC84DRAFT_642228 [Paraphaeosphaeria sporulosa]OAG07181.1 hypothetical protein CC84DRAFT_642228 [Paraphaeosphaeria sporulosa]